MAGSQTRAVLISGPEGFTDLNIPMLDVRIPAGRPIGGFDEPSELGLLGEFLARNSEHTYCFEASGHSMTGSGIDDGDLLIVDRSVVPKPKSIVVFEVDGEYTVKRFEREAGIMYLVPTNPDFEKIQVKRFDRFRAWGVVTYIIKRTAL